MTASVTSTEAQEGQPTSGFWALTLGSIGVVFGDIGTSPLYAFREAASHAAEGQPVSRIIGSREFWGLKLEITPAVLDPRPDTETVVEAALDWLTREESKVSCHYLVDEDGRISQMVREAERAWHAGHTPLRTSTPP